MRVIAIDGPAGAGKSTVASHLAERLGMAELDTGAMYRAVTWLALHKGIPLDDSEAVAQLAESMDLALDDTAVVVDGHDVTTAIRTPQINSAVSVVAANSAVRSELVRRQRAWAAGRSGAVVEGRDIGSVVFPDATLKVYLTARPEVRARRRAAEIGETDERAIDKMAAALAARDAYDSGRADSPLQRVDGAVVLDTSEREIDDVVEEIVRLLP
jgi:cytidylate kinase